MEKIPVALQMYTLRQLAQQDFAGTLRAVADIGYRYLELAGYGDLPAAALRRLLDDLSLAALSSHVGLDRLAQNLDAELDYLAELSAQYVVCPALPEPLRRDADGWRRAGEQLTRIGERAAARGLRLCYHNHSFEFARFDGHTGLDLLLAASDPRHVLLEVDVYWVQYAGEDPAAFIRRHADRVALVHLKDMAPGPQREFAEVGEGILDFPAIFQACEEAARVGLYVVEQDLTRRPPLESVSISLNHLREWGKA